MELEAVRDIIPNPNGLVHTILDAYNVHREFILRPGDVWTSEVVIARSSFFVNARAELLREHIVAHEDFVLVARQKTDFMPTHSGFSADELDHASVLNNGRGTECV